MVVSRLNIKNPMKNTLLWFVWIARESLHNSLKEFFSLNLYVKREFKHNKHTFIIWSLKTRLFFVFYPSFFKSFSSSFWFYFSRYIWIIMKLSTSSESAWKYLSVFIIRIVIDCHLIIIVWDEKNIVFEEFDHEGVFVI